MYLYGCRNTSRNYLKYIKVTILLYKLINDKMQVNNKSEKKIKPF